MDPDRTELPWRFGNTHGFCVTGGLPPIASEPTPSPRLWATPPGATPAGLCEHTMRADRRLSIPELSTLAGIGTFYFGPTHASGACAALASRLGARGFSRRAGALFGTGFDFGFGS